MRWHCLETGFWPQRRGGWQVFRFLLLHRALLPKRSNKMDWLCACVCPEKNFPLFKIYLQNYLVCVPAEIYAKPNQTFKLIYQEKCISSAFTQF